MCKINLPLPHPLFLQMPFLFFWALSKPHPATGCFLDKIGKNAGSKQLTHASSLQAPDYRLNRRQARLDSARLAAARLANLWVAGRDCRMALRSVLRYPFLFSM